MATVLIDGENVRRSTWPNLGRDELEDRARAWADANGHDVLVVWERRDESADDWIARHAGDYEPYWLVTSDRELRERAGREAERVIGGGAFLRELSAGASE